MLVPALRESGWVEEAAGNLSDTVAAGTPGDLGSGDDVSCRTFAINKGRIDVEAYALNSCAHVVSSATTHTIELTPFDEDGTSGSYLLAVCPLGAFAAEECSFSAFDIQRAPRAARVAGRAYYEANADGLRNEGETALEGWPVAWTGSVAGSVLADASGLFDVELEAGSYSLAALVAASPWQVTGIGADSVVASGRSLAEALADDTYALTLDGGVVSGLDFGAVCLGRGGIPGMGFWSNSSGEQAFGEDELALVNELPLRNEDGTFFDPASYEEFRTWYQRSSASNVAYKLSSELAAIELSILNGYIDPDALAYAPGADGANTLGFATVESLVNETRASLELIGSCSDTECHAERQALRSALRAANKDSSFIQTDPAACPAPVFAP